MGENGNSGATPGPENSPPREGPTAKAVLYSMIFYGTNKDEPLCLGIMAVNDYSACLIALGLTLRVWPQIEGFQVFRGRTTDVLVASCPLLGNAKQLQKNFVEYLGVQMPFQLAEIIVPKQGEEFDLNSFFGRKKQ